MTWWLIIIVVVCAAGCLWGLRFIARYEYEPGEGWEGVLSCLVLAAIFCWAWPAIIVWQALQRFDSDAFMARAVGRTQEQRERELRSREQHVAEMERELGIGVVEEADPAPLPSHRASCSEMVRRFFYDRGLR